MDYEGDYKLKKHTSDYYKKAKLFYTNNIYDDMKSHLEFPNRNFKFLLSFKKNADNVYTREGFNKYGDNVSHFGKGHHFTFKDNLLKLKYRFWDGIEAINQFNEYANNMNVKVFYLFPDYPLSEYDYNKKAISQFIQT